MADHQILVDVNFGNANQNFQTLIDSMNKLQGIVTQLGTTVQSFNDKTTSSNNNAVKSLKVTAKTYEDYKLKIEELRSARLKERESLSALIKAEGRHTDEVKKKFEQLRKSTVEINKTAAAIDKYENSLNKATSTAKKATTTIGSLEKSFNKLGAVLGISFGLYGGFRVLTDVVKTIADFNLAQKKLQSILGLSNKAMQDVALSAIEVGKDSIFGAKGVTELQIELAKMGFAKEEIVAMQGAIVNLATATQEELAPSAEVVANVLRAFQLTAEDATMVVDIMGKAFNDSALDLSNFRESIKYVAPIAKQAGFTFAETTALLEQLSNAGIKGSLAGTGLTNILSRLGNENSKFVKTLGRTVNGFDDFIVSLIELKSKGADLSDVFQLVDRRAAATFSILLQGVSTVEEFNKKLQDSAGVMKDQAGVQLESLTFKTQLLKNSWDGFILSIDSGDGVLSRALGSAVDNATSFLGILNEIVDLGQKNLAEKRLQQTLSFYEQLGIPTPKELNEIVKSVTDTRTKIGANALDIVLTLATGKPSGGQTAKLIENNINRVLDKADEGVNKKIKELALADVEQMKSYFGGNWISELPTLIATISLNNQQTDKATVSYKKQKETLRLLNLEYEAYLKTLSLTVPEPGGDANKIVQDRIKAELNLLELQKKIRAEEIKLDEESYAEKILLSKNELNFDIQIAQKNREIAIASGEDKVAAYKKFALEVELIELKHANELQSIWEDIAEKAEKISAKVDKSFIDRAKNRVDKQKEVWDDMISAFNDSLDKEREFYKENPVWAALGFGAGDEDTIDALKEGFDLAKDYITGWADKWVEQTERVVDARNNMVDELEQSLQTEIALAEAGFASNVSIKRKELEEAKLLREKALEDAKKARKAQAQVETAEQLGALITAAANILKGWSTIPFVGQVLGIAAIGAMLTSFIGFRVQASKAAATDKFEKGGSVGGRRHSQGGTMIEAEQGEFVVNRRSAAKHKLMIEAINNDDTFSLNKMYINGLKNGVLKASVSLDDSTQLDKIYEVLSKKGKEVTYFGNYRIEKTGNITTKILMN